MDTFFLAHGSVKLVVDDSKPVRSFLQSWKSSVMQEAPKALLWVSGHWDTDAPTVNLVHGVNNTIHDFTGVPEFFYKLKYPAPRGGRRIIFQPKHKWVKELLDKSGFGPFKEDKTRGLDHGTWVPLMLMYPEANVPVCQLSVQTGKGAEYHYNLGKTLAPLRDEGVLVIGSGNTTHNLQVKGPNGGPIAKWASDFDTWLKDSLLNGRYDDVNKYEEKAPDAKMAQPHPDHFFPLHVALGAAGHGAKAKLIHHSWSDSVISYASYRFTGVK